MFQYSYKLCNQSECIYFFKYLLFYGKILKVLLLSFKKVYNTYWEDGLLRKLLTAQAWEFKFRSLHPWKSQSVAEIAGSMRLTGMSSSSNEWASGWEESLSRRIRWREIKASVVSTCTHTCVWWHLCVPHSQMQSLIVNVYSTIQKHIRNHFSYLNCKSVTTFPQVSCIPILPVLEATIPLTTSVRSVFLYSIYQRESEAFVILFLAYFTWIISLISMHVW